jgi:DeoR family transcriptional regulator, suf operon transcriptional repressor
MKSTRERILQTLLNHPRSTILDLSAVVGINAISVRHHLTSLQADGYITAEEERHGVGRPRLVYFLTDSGLEKFPTNYLKLTNRLLDQLKSSLPAPTIDKLFTQIADEMSAHYASQAKNLSTEKKLDLIKEILAKDGFSMEWEKADNEYQIHEISCPYIQVGQKHPEVCSVDQKMMSSLLSLPVQKVSCVLSGDHECTFAVTDEVQSEPSI